MRIKRINKRYRLKRELKDIKKRLTEISNTQKDIVNQMQCCINSIQEVTKLLDDVEITYKEGLKSIL